MKTNLPETTSEYKKQLTNAVISILAFFAVYFLLIILTFAIAGGLCYLAAKLLTFKIGIWSLLFAAGMVCMGGLIIFFMFKFIFSKLNTSNEDSIEITRTTEPKLFELIDDVVAKTNTPQPKRVFLVPEVNAFVSYNSVFISMFLPVKKNLTIGLGLVNSTTISEFKAILAHEFGHFSQRSMKVGSFTFQANKIIYDMLFNNNSFENATRSFARIHGVLQIFTYLTLLYVAAMRWILVKTYDLLYLKHMALSRQMEFNADAIATYTVGSEINSAALLRLDISENALQSAVNFFAIHTDFKTENIYN